MENVFSSRLLRLPASLAGVVRIAAFAAGLIAAAAPAAAIPNVQRVVSPAGIEAWLLELNDVPLITFRLSFEGGTLQDPDGKYGTGSMAAYLFDEGAGAHDSFELKKRLTRIGATLGASAQAEFFGVSFSTPTANKDEAIELLRLALHAPRFDDEPMGRARARHLASIEAAQKNPTSVAAHALQRELFGKHPFAVDWSTRKAGYESIDRADIAAYRRRILARDNLKVAVVGNMDAATLAPLLDRLLGSLPAKADLRPLPAPAGAVGSCQLVAMDIPQAFVGLAALTPPLTWQQRLAWAVLQSVLTEGISAGRLSRELREKRGLVYGVATGYGHYESFGLFEVNLAARMDEVPQAMALTRAELRRMLEEGPTEAEVATVRPALAGRYLLGLDTGAALANLMLSMQINKRPITFLNDLEGDYEKITRQDVWEVAKLLLDPDRLTTTVVGATTQTKVCDSVAAASK